MTHADSPPFFADVALARRLERAEGQSSADFVAARAKCFPDCGATWTDVAGAFAMYDGPTSPLTQTFGLGLFDPIAAAELDRLEAFFRDRGAPVCHEISPLADAALLPLLTGRGYQPIELTTVLVRPLRPGDGVAASDLGGVRVRPVRDDEHDLWAETAVRGWEATGDLADFMRQLGRINPVWPNSLAFLAELDGEPIGTGAMSVRDGVAHLAGASTVPAWRRRGGQLALLDARLRYAADHGCDVATMGASPGSASQRNAERHGFRVAYTRIKWQLVTSPPATGR
jgi:GNAT superfamily N-acetyltransferase